MGCRTVHCFKKIWLNKRTHPNKRQNGHQLSTKWALGSDQSSVRSRPCAVARRCAGMGCPLIRQLANYLLNTDISNQANSAAIHYAIYALSTIIIINLFAINKQTEFNTE